jgi:hypothetical protein
VGADTPASVSQIASIIGMNHHTQPFHLSSKNFKQVRIMIFVELFFYYSRNEVRGDKGE